MYKTQKWSDEDELKLFEISKRLHTEKNPPSMAKITLYFPGKTRNSIIGKLYRSGLNLNKSAKKRKIKKVVKLYFSKSDIKANKKLNIDMNLFEEFNDKTILLFDSGPKHCRFPIGTSHCCGDVIQSRSYCKKHFELSYEKPDEQIVE